MIEDEPGPDLDMQPHGDITCLVASAELQVVTVYDSLSNLTYTWSTADGNIMSGHHSQICEVSAGGSYTLTVEDLVNGCIAEISTTVLEDTEGPDLTVTSGTTIDCENQEIVVTVKSDADTTTYQWTSVGGNILGPLNGESVIVDTSGIYTVSATNPLTGCSTDKDIQVEDERDHPLSDFTFEAEELEVTFNNLSDTENASYTWDFGDGKTSTERDPKHTYSAGGLYYVCLYVANSCGQAGKCVEVVVSSGSSPLSLSSTIVDVTCFGGANGSINIEAIGGSGSYIYEWTGPGAFSSDEQNLENLAAGTYTILIEDSEGNLYQQSFEVQQPTELIVTLESTPGFDGYTLEVFVTGGTPGYTYEWSDGSSLPSIRNVPAGWYHCTVYDANGCAVATHEVYVPGTGQVDGDLNPDHKVQVFGNPNLQPVIVQISSARLTQSVIDTEHSYQVVSLSGDIVDNGEWYGDRTEIDLRGNAPGMYFVVVRDAEGSWQSSEKLILTE